MSEARALETIQPQLDEFIDAFNNLDLHRFMRLWAPDPTAIHPFPEMPKRLDGLNDVSAAWSSVFEFMRQSLPGPPYLQLVPVDLDVRRVAPGAILVTFHLDLPTGLGRRTLLFVEEDATWKLVHLHASNVTTET
jgi:hypothetical protein